MKLFNSIAAFMVWMRGLFSSIVPAVTGADLTTLSDVLKEVYDPVVEDQQNLEAMTWNEFEDGNDELGGEGWVFSTKMGGNQEGIGARAERGTLPLAGHQRWKKGLITWALCYGTFELTGPVIEAAKSNLEAFASARTDELEGLTRDTIKDFNRQVYGSGNGVLATVSGHTGAPSNTFQVTDGMYLRENMMVDIWDGTNVGTKNIDSRQITDLSPNADGTMDVTLDGATFTAVATDTLIREDAATSVSSSVRTNHEMTGLQAIIDDGTLAATFEDITRADYPLWKGHVLDNSAVNRNLTLDLMQQAEDAVYRAANKRPDWVRMNLGQRRKFFDLVAPDRRFDSTTFEAGFEHLSYNGLKMTVDIDCPKGKIIWLTRASVKKYTLRKFGLLDFDGLVLRQQAGKDVYDGHLGIYGNLGSKRPNCNAILTDLTEPTEEQWVW